MNGEMKSHYELSRGNEWLSSHSTLEAAAAAAKIIISDENPQFRMTPVGSGRLNEFSTAMLAHNLSICESTIVERSPDPETAMAARKKWAEMQKNGLGWDGTAATYRPVE
jgi:DNA-binding LacI/PurR family transcriptional regulator